MAIIEAPEETPARTLPAARRRPRGPIIWVRAHIIPILGWLALLYLFLPIFVVVAFSFNAPNGRFNYQFDHFSIAAWTNLCGPAGLCDSLKYSLMLGLLATAGSVLLGTLMAFSMSRYRFRGRTPLNLLIFLPMATPEVVMGSSLLTLFLNLKIPLGFVTILIAHIMFCLSFVVVTVKARLAGLDPRLEQAAADLYANERSAFWRITFPLVLPGIVAAALLAFSLSFDDFIITSFNSGQAVTFPMFVWGASQRGAPPQVNVVGSLMFFVALIVVLAGQFRSMRRKSNA
jgi:spermidine/putrescine transport system permease protein